MDCHNWHLMYFKIQYMFNLGNVLAHQMSSCLYYELLPSVSDGHGILGMAEALKTHLNEATWKSSHKNIDDLPTVDNNGKGLRLLLITRF